MQLAEGTIIKALSGFFYVQDNEDKQVYQCRGRGILKKNNISPLVGDHVYFSITTNQEGTIDEVKPRKNEFFRPKVANVDQVLLVFTYEEPSWNQRLLDRFIVMAESVSVESIIVFNKIDLLSDEQLIEVNEFKRLYESIGYKVIFVSTVDDLGKDKLNELLKNRISMFSGQSGVGKSSILNYLEPYLNLKTGVISNKLGRGKHTTRHVELFSLSNGGFIVDTPGFSQIDLLSIEEISLLASYFRDINAVSDKCKYRRCTHTVEDGCNVIAQVNAGNIQQHRYNHYVELTEALKEHLQNKY